MEQCFMVRYLTSQDQVIVSLNQQIRAILPLSDSYTVLQNYQIKLQHDFQSVLSQQDIVQNAYASMINDLNILARQLNGKKTQYLGQFQNFANTKSKLTIDRQSLIYTWETLCNQLNTQNQQTMLLQEQKKQILYNGNKSKQAISMIQKLIDQISIIIKQNQQKHLSIQNQIWKLTQYSQTLTKNILTKQTQIKLAQSIHEKDLSQIKTLEQHQMLLGTQVDSATKQNKQMKQKILAKKTNLDLLNHQKQYTQKLIDNESHLKQDLKLSQTKLTNHFQTNLKQKQKAQSQIVDLQKLIQVQKAKKQKSLAEQQTIKLHQTELILSNSLLLQSMKISCIQDKQIHELLHKKKQIVSLIQTGTIQSKILKDQNNQFKCYFKFDKSASTWGNQPASRENWR